MTSIVWWTLRPGLGRRAYPVGCGFDTHSDCGPFSPVAPALWTRSSQMLVRPKLDDHARGVNPLQEDEPHPHRPPEQPDKRDEDGQEDAIHCLHGQPPSNSANCSALNHQNQAMRANPPNAAASSRVMFSLVIPAT